MWVKASAPGSLMLLGEYAVLHGKHALVCAVDKRMQVTLVPHEAKHIDIRSPLGHLQTPLSTLEVVAPFQFVTATLKKFQKQLKTGCQITIESEFSDQIGFGSSAAVTVATLAAMAAWLGLNLSPLQLIREARAIVRQVQGTGSGADVAACVLGRMVAYKTSPLYAQSIATQHPLTVIYSGYKTKTVDAIQQVKTQFANYPDVFTKLCHAIDSCVVQGIEAARAADWESMGRMMNIQQGLMESLGVSTATLSQIVQTLRSHKNILGAKISGSGLGDCLVGLGDLTDRFSFSDTAVQHIPVKMATRGVYCEKG